MNSIQLSFDDLLLDSPYFPLRISEVHIGHVFERLTVISGRIDRFVNGRQRTYFMCRCRCGVEKEIDTWQLTRGKTRSCGCLSSDVTAARNYRHGETLTRLYKAWSNMLTQCGQRREAIRDKLYEAWQHFLPFKEWALRNGYADRKWLKRKDNKLPFSPDNCLWISVEGNTKFCPGCDLELDHAQFYPSRSRSDGLTGLCKQCQRSGIDKAAQEFREGVRSLPATKECTKCHVVKPSSEFWLKENHRLHPWCKACHGKVLKAIYVKNRAKILEQGRAYRLAHPEIFCHTARKARNPRHMIVSRALWHRRRARLLAQGGSYTHDEWILLCKMCGNICLRCRERKNLTVDHVVPILLGGTNDISNLQPLCGSCNSHKHAKTIDYRPDHVRLAFAFELV